jgi:tetratricopeptide (TPR) repeat protein
MSIIHEALSKAERESSRSSKVGSGVAASSWSRLTPNLFRIAWKLPLVVVFLTATSLMLYTRAGPVFSRLTRIEAISRITQIPSPVPRTHPGERKTERVLTEQTASPMEEGVSSYRKGEFQVAERTFRQVVQSSPEMAEGHNNLGIALRSQGRLEEAALHYKEALRIKPGYPEAAYNLGAVYDREGRSDEAIAHYRKALDLSPSLIEARYQLAIALEKRGEMEAAMAEYRTLLEKFKGDPRPEMEQVRRHLRELQGD